MGEAGDAAEPPAQAARPATAPSSTFQSTSQKDSKNAEHKQKQIDTPESPSNLNLGLVGNGRFAALIDKNASVEFACFPRLDSDPVFCHLIGPKGELKDEGVFGISIVNMARTEQRYSKNSAVLVTKLYDKVGGAIEVTDFAPRFRQYGRVFRPTMLIRKVKPLAGYPMIQVRLRPLHSYGKSRPTVTHGSNSIRYVMPNQTIRLTTDAPVTFVAAETEFILEDEIYFVLGPDEMITRSLPDMCRDFLEKTEDYWQSWVRSLVLPFEWQEAVIRAAITVKMCTYEESGAIVAAITTSIPEHPRAERNWDYRFCWLRDASNTIHTLNRLGAVQMLEDFLRFLTNIIHKADGGLFNPVFGIAMEKSAPEVIAKSLGGYRGCGPVRYGNRSFDIKRSDVYGSVIMAATQFFFDKRITHPGNVRLYHCLEKLGMIALEVYDKPELTGFFLTDDCAQKRLDSFCAVMSWAACDRLAKIANQISLRDRSKFWRQHAEKLHREISAVIWNGEVESFVSTFNGDKVDASLLLLPQVGFVKATDPKFVSTLSLIEKRLMHEGMMYRDEATVMQNERYPMFVCTFWYISALKAVGRDEEARELFEKMLDERSDLGLLSSEFGADTQELWGNYPSTHVMVSLIHCALALSKPWEEMI